MRFVRHCFARIASVVVMAAIGGPVTAAVQDGSNVQRSWRLQLAGSVQDASILASGRKERILVWADSGAPKAAVEAHLLINAPLAKIQPAVQAALNALGKFESSPDSSALAYLPEHWSEVLLSRRPDLRDALARRFTEPKLKLAQDAGVLSPEEVAQRLAKARADIHWDVTRGNEIDAFKVTYGGYNAWQNRSYGLIHQSKSELGIQLFDMSAAFGHPATVVRITREDTYPNPDYSLLHELRNFNPLGGGQSSTLTRGVVPADVFEAVRKAMMTAAPGAELNIASSPLAWVQPVASASTVLPIHLAVPATDGATLQAEAIPLDTLIGRKDMPLYPHDLLTLPGGDLLFSAEILTEGSSVWRLHPDGRTWKVETVWHGREDVRQLALSADGGTVWFSGAGSDNGQVRLYAYDAKARHVASYAVNLGNSKSIQSLEWQLSSAQTPAYFDRGNSSDANPLGTDLFVAWQPKTSAPVDGGMWAFDTTLHSLRQSFMQETIRPVLWRGSHGFWTEDSVGVTEFNAADGRVLRVIPLPQRVGAPGQEPDGKLAPWSPKPLASFEAGWIATGFMLMLADSELLPPEIKKGARSNDRFFGMYVVDLKSGSVLHSVLLGRSDTLQAAARSANGRFLALGSTAAQGPGPIVVLWNVANGKTPVSLAGPARGELKALAFSWHGTELWALGSRELLRWRLPDSLGDSARGGSFPEQSHN